MFSRDLILEGVRPADVIALRHILGGEALVSESMISRLAAKGWLEVQGGIPLITLTGGTLLHSDGTGYGATPEARVRGSRT